MLKDNIAQLRLVNGLTQEAVAREVGVSRQAYAKWEKGESVPDVERCAKLAALFGTSVDTLINFEQGPDVPLMPPAPKGKHIWGTVTVGERGQIVIPKAARETFGIASGDKLVVLGDENEGIGLVPAKTFEERMKAAMAAAGIVAD